jgi:hypothetical protein
MCVEPLRCRYQVSLSPGVGNEGPGHGAQGSANPAAGGGLGAVGAEGWALRVAPGFRGLAAGALGG